MNAAALATSTSFYAKLPFSKVYATFLSSDVRYALEAVLLNTLRRRSISHAKHALGWALIRVNLDNIQEIGPKVGGGRSFEGGRSFARLW